MWEQEIGFKQLEIVDKHFRLNQMPMILRMSSIVWHRAYRDTQFQELAYDSEWFCEEIIKRLKRYGVNTLRFHLGNPPRRFLELCDKHGLLTQVEWIFFHEANACADSMERQESRVWLHTLSNGKVAEYWRLLHVAGFSPFCLLSSPQNGNTHFFECLKKPVEMPVWEALKPAFSQIRIEKEIVIPNETGMFRLTTTLGDAVSSWDIYVHRLQIPEFDGRVGTLSEEKELAAFLHECNIHTTNDWTDCDVILGMQETYKALKRERRLYFCPSVHSVWTPDMMKRVNVRMTKRARQYWKKLHFLAIFRYVSVHFRRGKVMYIRMIWRKHTGSIYQSKVSGFGMD